MIEMMRRAESETSATDQLDTAFKSGVWLNLSYYVKNGRVFLNETSCDFPFADFPVVLDLLKQALEKKLGSVPPAPLPVADHVVEQMKEIEERVVENETIDESQSDFETERNQNDH